MFTAKNSAPGFKKAKDITYAISFVYIIVHYFLFFFFFGGGGGGYPDSQLSGLLYLLKS